MDAKYISQQRYEILPAGTPAGSSGCYTCCIVILILKNLSIFVSHIDTLTCETITSIMEVFEVEKAYVLRSSENKDLFERVMKVFKPGVEVIIKNGSTLMIDKDGEVHTEMVCSDKVIEEALSENDKLSKDFKIIMDEYNRVWDEGIKKHGSRPPPPGTEWRFSAKEWKWVPHK